MDYDRNPWKYTEEEFRKMKVELKHLLSIFLAYLLVYGGFGLPLFFFDRAYYTIRRNQLVYYGKLKAKRR